MKNFFTKHKDSFIIIGIVFFWRLALQIATYLGTHKFNIAKPDPWPTGILSSPWYFAKWDSGWYLSIVEHGYFWNEKTQSSVAFFPLYPLLMKGIGFFVGKNYLLAGVIISHVALIVGLIFLRKLIELDFQSSVASRALLYLLLFPTSFFFISVYPESLFFALAVGAFYAARKKMWLVAGVLAALASLTKFIGVFLPVALIIEYLHQKNFRLSRIRGDILYLGIGFFGIISYMLYLKQKFGNALLFIRAQEGYRRAFAWPWETLRTYIDFLHNNVNVAASQELYLIRIFELAFLFVFIILIIIAFKKLKTSYVAFSLLTLAGTLFAGSFQSTERYVLVLFPCFIVLGLLGKNRVAHHAFIMFFSVLLTVYTILFTNWHWAG